MEIMRVDRSRSKVWAEAKSKEKPAVRNRLHRGGRFVSLPDFPAMPTAKKTKPRPRRPAKLHPDLESVLFTESQIKERVKSLGQELKAVYGDSEFTIIAIINGAMMFTADLMREIDNPIRVDCIRISSYGDKTQSIG